MAQQIADALSPPSPSSLPFVNNHGLLRSASLQSVGEKDPKIPGEKETAKKHPRSPCQNEVKEEVSFSLSLLRGLTSFPPDLQEGRSPCSSLAARERETASSCVCPQSEAGRRKERTSTSEKEIPVLARDKIRRGANERGRRLARGFARCLSDKWRWRLLA